MSCLLRLSVKAVANVQNFRVMEVKFGRENVSQTLLEAKMQFICATDSKLVSNNEAITHSPPRASSEPREGLWGFPGQIKTLAVVRDVGLEFALATATAPAAVGEPAGAGFPNGLPCGHRRGSEDRGPGGRRGHARWFGQRRRSFPTSFPKFRRR